MEISDGKVLLRGGHLPEFYVDVEDWITRRNR